MFVTRSISLNATGAVVAQPLLRRANIADVAIAEELLDEACREAQTILDDARSQRDSMLGEVQAEVWQHANEFLKSWQVEREAQREAIVQQAEMLLQQALREIFDEVPEPRRVELMLRQLAVSQQRPVEARVGCHPSLLRQVKAWLQEQPVVATLWTVQSDSGLSPDRVHLSTSSGEFSVDWASIKRSLTLLTT